MLKMMQMWSLPALIVALLIAMIVQFRGSVVWWNVVLVAALVSTTIGLLLGSLAGMYAGWVDPVIMRATDVVLSFPVLVVILTVVALVVFSLP